MKTRGGCVLGGTRPVSNTIHEPSVRVVDMTTTRTLVKPKTLPAQLGGTTRQEGYSYYCTKLIRNQVGILYFYT
jgi:hypothetical protein